MDTSSRSERDAPIPDGATDRPSYSEDGVDLTLIRWMLSLTPAERLEVLRQSTRYEDLLSHTYIQHVSGGVPVRLLDPISLDAIKEETRRDKDQATLAILRRTPEEKGKG